MIDLHCHSTCSDGTFTPEELAEKGRDFACFALTDHDTCAGCRRFFEATRGQRGVRLAGVELSVDPGEGYGDFHLLGIGVDPENAELNEFTQSIRQERDARNRRMVDNLAKLGMEVPFDDVMAQAVASGETVGRPHLARAMMSRGYVASVKEAFDRFLGDGRPAYSARRHPSQAESIARIHAAGGVAVMAHPRYWTSDPDALRSGLKRLMDMGLDGIEALYQTNPPAVTIAHLRLARELGLVVTAGSDFHGANKPEISLGMRIDDETALLAPLLARLEERRR